MRENRPPDAAALGRALAQGGALAWDGALINPL